MKTLDISHNNLISLKGIELIPNLENIFVNYNPLEDISDLKDLKHLEFIRASKESIPQRYHHFLYKNGDIIGRQIVEKLQLFLKLELELKKDNRYNLLI